MKRNVSLPSNWRAWPTDAKYRFLLRLNKLAAEQSKEVVSVLPEALDLEGRGWRVWYAAVFGQRFVDALDSQDTEDRHHSEAIEWHWNARRALISIEVQTRTLNAQRAQGVIDLDHYSEKIAELENLRPEFLAYFTIWARGNLKTTILRRIVVCDACLSVSGGVGGYALIVGGTKTKIRSTANSINALLTKPLAAKGSEVWRYYPQLAEVRRNKFGRSQGWTTDLFLTNADYVFHFAGLEEGLAGANEEDVRPTFILPDDIDTRKDSVVESERKFQVFTREILPMGARGTLTLWAQNLISRYSSLYRVWKQQARVLTNRVVTDPVPAVRRLVTTVQTVNGIVKDIYVSGKATWREWSKPGRIQEEIDRYGLPSFLRECQHEIEQDRVGLVLQHWNDEVHVITRTEFARIFKTNEIPRAWNKYVVNDWARTKTQYHANVAFTLAVSAQNSPLPGCYFIFNPYSFPAGSSPEDVAERILTGICPLVRREDGVMVSWRDLIKSVLEKSELDSHKLTTTELIDARRNVLADIIPRYVDPILKAQNYIQFRGSHEQSKTGALAVYSRVFGLPFHGTNPGGDGGVDTVNMAQRVDYGVPHPIKPIHGYTRFFLVVDDNKAAFPEALSPVDLVDSDLFRFQMANWRLRDPYLTAKGEIEGDLLKLNDDFGNCFTAGTLIHTSAGQRAIESISVGDLVWTRGGLRRVLVAGPTGRHPTYSVQLSNGRELCGTANHPVWTQTGWTDLCCLLVGDTLTACRDQAAEQSALNSKASRFTDIPMPNRNPAAGTLAHTSQTGSGALKPTMLKSGSRYTALYRRALRFTTKTVTLTTMTLVTWKRRLAANMRACTPWSVRTVLNGWPTWLQFDLSAELGTEAQKGKNGIASTLRPLSGSLSPSVANSAATSTQQSSRAAGFALSSALGVSDMTSSGSVRVVKGPTPSGVHPTYNLQVEGDHEYFANGVLVHNCLMMLFYDGILHAAELKYHEKVEEAMQPKHREILAAVTAGQGVAPEQELSLLFAIEHAKRLISDDGVQEFDEYGNRIY